MTSYQNSEGCVPQLAFFNRAILCGPHFPQAIAGLFEDSPPLWKMIDACHACRNYKVVQVTDWGLSIAFLRIVERAQEVAATYLRLKYNHQLFWSDNPIPVAQRSELVEIASCNIEPEAVLQRANYHGVSNVTFC